MGQVMTVNINARLNFHTDPPGL